MDFIADFEAQFGPIANLSRMDFLDLFEIYGLLYFDCSECFITDPSDPRLKMEEEP